MHEVCSPELTMNFSDALKRHSFAILLFIGILARITALNQPLIDAHLLRQCQTAYATREMIREPGFALSTAVPWHGDSNTKLVQEVLTRMDPEPFAALLSEWLGAQAGTLPGALALDGKMIRNIIGMVSLVEVEDGSPVALAVMDQKEATGRCELKVAQQLLAALPALDGKTITADPLHCQKETAEEAEGNSGGRRVGEPHLIIEKGGDYLLQIKGNQPTLLATARAATRGSPLLSKPPAATGASKPAP